jgi:hypothetical protein
VCVQEREGGVHGWDEMERGIRREERRETDKSEERYKKGAEERGERERGERGERVPFHDSLGIREVGKVREGGQCGNEKERRRPTESAREREPFGDEARHVSASARMVNAPSVPERPLQVHYLCVCGDQLTVDNRAADSILKIEESN